MEVERENNYKKFFKEYDQNMNERMSTHMKYVIEPTIDKQIMLDEIEERNEKDHNEYLDEKERREKEERLKQQKEMHEQNRMIFSQKDREKTQKREMYQKLVEQRKKEEDDYKSYQQRQLEEDEERRKLYREALEYQKGYQEYNKNHLGQMTQMEKKLNNNDLKQFKQQKYEYQGMIPGIHNLQSVGSRPLLRKANEDIYESQSKAPSFMSKHLNRSSKDLRSNIKPLEDFGHMHEHKNNDNFHKNKGSEDHYGMLSARHNDRYDPITNPIPFVNQNPYISKEKSLIGGEGTSNLVTSTQRRSRRSLLSSTAEKNILI